MTTEPLVYFVPLVDVTWANFAPLSPERDYIAEPPPLDVCAREVEACVDEMISLTGGKAVYAVHSGYYNRRGFYEEPFLGFFRKAVAHGAEICLHTHEEIARQGTMNADEAHMLKVIRDRRAELEAAGLQAKSYRGGHFAYLDYLTPALEGEGVCVDFSSAPGLDRPSWDARWGGAPLSAHYLRYGGHAGLDGPVSSILEIPLGADGLGGEIENMLYTEAGEDGRLERVWEHILERGRWQGPQFVHILFHTSSLGMPHYLDRFRRFMDHTVRTGASLVTPMQAKAAYDRLNS
ncbi:hypothetical protein [Bosea sp. (in: a-proteobacteria)]|uniref:hypothetical protein n=1 Tax=Bosea sp. (in: a-proteobacteria) TaxID=1871050 RepID=UPI00261B04AD|nr:hypothetical protein [Bosea sp. (in: a-proteobacteria)]MCO5092151.1 hypothetical protein [Bosea sp. (in: a-proteobacteria)]